MTTDPIDPAIVEAALREFTKPRMHTGMSLDTTRGNLTAALEASAPLIAAKALRPVEILARALLSEHERLDDIRAEAWDEGYTRGFYDRETMPGEVRDASEGPSENPYHADALEEGQS